VTRGQKDREEDGSSSHKGIKQGEEVYVSCGQKKGGICQWDTGFENTMIKVAEQGQEHVKPV
jgi:hypothetical protein